MRSPDHTLLDQTLLVQMIVVANVADAMNPCRSLAALVLRPAPVGVAAVALAVIVTPFVGVQIANVATVCLLPLALALPHTPFGPLAVSSPAAGLALAVSVLLLPLLAL